MKIKKEKSYASKKLSKKRRKRKAKERTKI
jgi:hypothetical protein